MPGPKTFAAQNQWVMLLALPCVVFATVFGLMLVSAYQFLFGLRSYAMRPCSLVCLSTKLWFKSRSRKDWTIAMAPVLQVV